ncbi:DUF3775 domain-containing protein [Sphingomonas sabuli]|uniref:DUF3775 domain-containing protein n=1 Tax=Sphingomonas sabuli TaxID=2764186 RepID=A0A7G9L3Q2_9SPHN|nr:DUF3775 domain-containing protein [Sphingomonas sabuli]QNM83251.1 DUF3775 domain-containing protein [Sphingomonas sabuli]
MDPATPLETLCRIILRAREYDAQTPSDYDDDEAASNVDDEDEGALSVLDDTINDSVEEELRSILEDLAEDQIIEVIAFSWVGAGNYDASEWSDALQDGQEMLEDGGAESIIDELLELPMLPSILESGLAAFDLSCDGIGELT